MRFAWSLVVLCALGIPARATVLHVPKDFATIQMAVDAAVAGDVIVVGPGSYHNVVNITGKTDLTVRGQGQAALVEGNFLQSSLFIISCTGVRVEHLRFEDGLGIGISVSDSSDVTLERLRFENMEGPAVFMDSCDDILLDHVKVDTTQNTGLQAQASDHVTLHHCSVSGTALDGIFLENCTDVVVDRASVEDSGADGIELDTVSAAVVSKCLVRNPAFSAITATGSAMLVEDNRMLDVAVTGGGLFSTVAGCVVRRNRVVGGGFAYNVGGSELQLLDNRSIKSGLIGLAIGGAFPVLASGNRVLKGAGTGIQVAGPDFSVLTDNKVSAAVVGFELNADDVQALDNRATGSVQNGFGVHGTGCLLVGNEAHGSGEFDLFDDTSGSTTYVDNDFGTTHFE